MTWDTSLYQLRFLHHQGWVHLAWPGFSPLPKGQIWYLKEADGKVKLGQFNGFGTQNDHWKVLKLIFKLIACPRINEAKNGLHDVAAIVKNPL